MSFEKADYDECKLILEVKKPISHMAFYWVYYNESDVNLSDPGFEVLDDLDVDDKARVDFFPAANTYRVETKAR